MLHIIAKSPIQASILERIDAGDSVLFIRSAVQELSSNGALSEQLNKLLQNQSNLAALTTDLQARGILPEQLVEGISIIDYPVFVELTIEHSLIQSW
jgi:sulfur relay protein TusB/DsrH